MTSSQDFELNPFENEHYSSKYNSLLKDFKELEQNVFFNDPWSGKSIGLVNTFFLNNSIWLLNAINDLKAGHMGVQKSQNLLTSISLRIIMQYCFEMTNAKNNDKQIIAFADSTSATTNLPVSRQILGYIRAMTWKDEDFDRLKKVEAVWLDASLTHKRLIIEGASDTLGYSFFKTLFKKK